LSDNDLDCDDTDASVNPDADEICNAGRDDDCCPLTFEVGMIGSAGFSSLGDAVAAAIDDDVIQLCDGTHVAQDVMIDKDVTITSQSGDRALSTLDGAGDVTGAILIVDGGSLTLTHVTVVNAADGAIDALTVGGGDITIDDCLFQDNSTVRSGGAIAGSTITITNSDFVGNSGGDGGAVYALAPGILMVTDSTFDGNTADLNGGGFYTSAAATFSGVDLIANVAANAGGGGAADGAEAFVTLVDTSFASNLASFAGGGLYLFGASGSADATTTFDANMAFNDYVAFGGGLGVLADGNAVTWTGGTFTGNLVNSMNVAAGGGAVGLLTSDGYGGAPGGSIEAAGIIADGNDVNGGIWGLGGGIYMLGAATLRDSVSPNNTATYGGGVAAYATFGGTTTLERVEMRANVGVFVGGMDMALADVVLTDCVVEENIASADPEVYDRPRAGAMQVDVDSVLEVISSDFGTDATDNVPWDIVVPVEGNPTFDFGSDTTFTCSYAAGDCE